MFRPPDATFLENRPGSTWLYQDKACNAIMCRSAEGAGFSPASHLGQATAGSLLTTNHNVIKTRQANPEDVAQAVTPSYHTEDGSNLYLVFISQNFFSWPPSDARALHFYERGSTKCFRDRALCRARPLPPALFFAPITATIQNRFPRKTQRVRSSYGLALIGGSRWSSGLLTPRGLSLP